MFETVPHDRLQQLPTAVNAFGETRLVGVEIELGGVGEDEAAHIVADELGGTVRQACDLEWLIEGSRLGKIKVYLDTRFRSTMKAILSDLGLDLARLVVPVELVTEPILPADIAVLDDLVKVLREHGATGTRDGILLGFGVHLNIEISGADLSDILPTLTAYALLEDALRETYELDVTRRLLPFTEPYPTAFVDALVTEPPKNVAALAKMYMAHTPSRNRGLDMLPVLMHLVPEQVDKDRLGDAVSARPAFHYRLPDCRISEPGWTIVSEWNRWVLLERVASDTNLLNALAAAWKTYRGGDSRSDWAVRCSRLLASAGTEMA